MNEVPSELGTPMGSASRRGHGRCARHRGCWRRSRSGGCLWATTRSAKGVVGHQILMQQEAAAVSGGGDVPITAIVHAAPPSSDLGRGMGARGARGAVALLLAAVASTA